MNRGSRGAQPGWYRVDMGDSYRVQAFAYLSRRGEGCIKDYNIYVTDDSTDVPANWGPPVCSGRMTDITNINARVTIDIPPANGRYFVIEALSVYSEAMSVRELWIYGDSVGPVMLPDPMAIRMYTGTAASALYSVLDPPDPAATILADIVVSDFALFSSVVVGGVDVTFGGTDVMTFDGDLNWECKEGAITINASDLAGPSTIQAMESTSGGYTPQNALGAAINVEVVERMVKMNGPLVIGLPYDGFDFRSVQIVDGELPAPGYVPVTLGTPAGASATIVANGDLGIFDGDFESFGTIDVTASAATAGFTTITVTAGNGFIFEESGTDTVTLVVLVTPSPDLYVSFDGSDETGDGTQANPFRTITHALEFAAAVPNVHVGPGTYDTFGGEVFPLAVPPGVAISAWPAEGYLIPDDYVIDGGGAATTLLTYTDVPPELPCSLDSLTITNTKATAITCSNATLDISNCVFSSIVTPQDSFWSAGNPSVILIQNDSKVTLNDCLFTANSGRGTIGLQEGTANNNNSLTATGCTWTGNYASIGTIYGHNNVIARTTLTDCVFTDNNSASSGAHDAPPGTMFYAIGGGTNPVVIERCIASGGNGGSVLSGRNNEFQVQNSLFFDNTPAAGNEFMHGYNWGANVVNCTFVNNGGSFTGRNPARGVNVRNSIISGQSALTTATEDGQKRLTVTNVLLWNTPVGEGYLPASTNIIELAPQFRSATNYHLRATSPAIDAGDNSLVVGEVDLDGNIRILDGKNTGTDVVDLGAYEFDPSVAVPAFKTPQHEYSMYTGSTVSVPVTIDPGAAGAVTADVTYGLDLSGPPTLSFGNGMGPVDLTVTVADTLTNPGTPSTVEIAESSVLGVDPGDFLVYLYAREATLAGNDHLFVKSGEMLDLKVTIPAEAPGDITITVGASAGSGTNVIAWGGAAVIPAGGVESSGSLSIIGGAGVNSITLSIDSGFVFTESGASSLTLTVAQIASPAYVTVDGSDTAGDGTLANPFGSIGYASSLLDAGDEVRVLPGTYTAPGETFPIQPGSVRIVAFDTAGPADPADHVIDGGGASVNLFAFTNTPAEETGCLANFTLTGCTKTAIACNAGVLTVDGCVFTGITTPNFGFWDPYGYSNSISLINDSEVTATSCTFSGNSGRGTVGADLDVANQNNMFTATGCTWTCNTSIIGTIYARFEVNMITSLTECTFDGNRAMGADTHDAPPSCVLYTNIRTGVPSVSIDRCTITNNIGGSILSPSQVRPIRISNTLFANNVAGTGFNQQFMHGYNWGAVVTNCTFVNNIGSLTAWSLTSNTFELENSIVSDQSVLSSNAQQEQLFLHNVILWNTPLGDGYNFAGSTNVIEQDPALTTAPVLMPNGTAIGTHHNNEQYPSRVITYSPTGLTPATTYTAAIKYVVPQTTMGGGNGKARLNLGTGNVELYVETPFIVTPVFTSDATILGIADSQPWAWWTGNITTPAEEPEGGFVLSIDNYDTGLLMDKVEIRSAIGEVIWSAEAEDGTLDPATSPLHLVTFEWYSAADAHLADGSPAIDAGDNEVLTAEDVVDLDGNPRIVDGNGDEVDTVDIGCYEYQGAPGATIASFTVSDRTSGSTLVTNEAAVTVAITVNEPEGITVVNWQITETDAEPAQWLTESPTAYTILAASGADVTLYAWIKDSTDIVSGKAATIYYDTRLPVVSNVVITAGAPGSGTATVTWDTDIPAEGSVMYGAVSMSGATPFTAAENALGTQHTVLISGIADGTNYRLVLVNNEKVEPPIFWPKPWPIEGDANMDCRVNILDLISIRNKLNQDVATGDNWKADVNEDGRINILDLIFVRNKLNTSCP